MRTDGHDEAKCRFIFLLNSVKARKNIGILIIKQLITLNISGR
jgi:hypothetical protein